MGSQCDVAWYRNDGAATPSFTKEQILNRGSGRRAVVALDLDGDGDVDVLDASSGQDTVSWYENRQEYNWGRDTSTTSWVTHVVTASARQAKSVAARDLDGDGDVDVLVASKDDKTVAWYENLGRVGYTPRVDFAQHIIKDNFHPEGFTWSGLPFDAAAADLDDDGVERRLVQFPRRASCL